MSTQTNKLGLFKYDPVVDKEELFDIQTSLNDNWDKIDKAVGSFSQADWNQNDPEAKDYVKNRTHWEDNSKNIVSESRCTTTSDGDTPPYTYTFTLNTDKVVDTYLVVFGANEILSVELTNNNDPIRVIDKLGEEILLSISVAQEESGIVATLSFNAPNYDGVETYVYELVPEIHKLDEKFLPDTIRELSNYVTPQRYGAKGDGVTDDTEAINLAIEAVENGGTVYFPDGVYLVSSSMDAELSEGARYSAIKVYQKENLKLSLAPNAHLKHRVLTEAELLAGNTSRYYIIGITNSSNIQVTGGRIEGEADEHITLYKDNENVFWWQDDGTYSRGHGYGICVRGSSNVRIDGCEVFNCFGDSLHVSQNDAGDKSNGVVIENCNLHDSTRQGISVTGATNTTVRNCEIYNIAGNSPQSGIDFEPNFVEGMNISSLVENCFIHDCAGYALINAKANKDAKIRNCRLYGWVTSTNDDTYPVEFTNCDILYYQSSNAYRNILHNCRIAECGIFEAGDDFYDCIFNPDLFNHVIDGHGSTIASLIAAGPDILPTSIGRFYRCKFHTENSGGYASNFMGWRNTGTIGDVVFNNCEFLIGLHTYKTFNIKALNNVEVTNCLFTTTENAYGQQFVEITAPNDARLVGNVFDVKALTSYTSTNSAVLVLHGKNVYVEGNQFDASAEICTYPITQDFISDSGKVYVLRNSMKAWNRIGNFATDASKFVSVDNIISTSISQAEFTEEYREKLDNVSSIISEAGFITEEEAKGYTDSKIANLNANGVQQTPLFANSINECEDTSKVYVLPDGNVYGYMYTEVAVGGYTNLVDTTSADFKSGYRYNISASIMTTSTSDKASSFVSNPFPCKQGDVLRIKGVATSAVEANVAPLFMVVPVLSDGTVPSNTGMFLEQPLNSSQTPVAWRQAWNACSKSEDGVITWEYAINNAGNDQSATNVSETITMVRVAGVATNGFENIVVTVNEEIIEPTIEKVYQWTSTGHTFIPADYEDRIIELEETTEALKSGGAYSGARWFALGDSITEGWASAVDASATSGYKQYLNTNTAERWVNIVAKKNGYELTNYGVGGTGYAHAKTGTVNAREQVANIDFSQCDMVTLAYGVNDWKGKATLGSMDDDMDTVDAFVPNMRYVIKKILTDNPYCKIFVITPLNCRSLGTYDTNWGINYANSENASGPGLEDIFQLEKTVCEYYGIELIDMTHCSIINRENIKSMLPDYVHPTVECHAVMARELAKKINFV